MERCYSEQLAYTTVPQTVPASQNVPTAPTQSSALSGRGSFAGSSGDQSIPALETACMLFADA